MSYFRTTTFRKPRPMPKPRKALKKVGRKGDFWLFVAKILDLFFIRIDLPKVCEKCHLADPVRGSIDPAHSRRRVDIRVFDWWYAFRVAALCQVCHHEIDSLGRGPAEPLIEKIISDRFRELGLSEQAVKKLLLECAEEVQMSDIERYGHFVVEL